MLSRLNHRFKEHLNRQQEQRWDYTIRNHGSWRILWTEELGRLQFIGLQRVGNDWSNLAACMKQETGQNEGRLWMCAILQENGRRSQRWFRDPPVYCQGFKQKPWGWGNPGGTTAVLTPAVSVKSIRTCVVPAWAMGVTLLPHEVQKEEQWVKEDYFWASRSKGICFARFWFLRPGP